MKTGVIIFARLSSRRFPRKALSIIGGKRLIEWAVEAAMEVGADHVILATSTNETDDELCEVASLIGLDVFRGALNDVLGRSLACAEQYKLDAFCRLNGDSPFTDPALIRKGFEMMSSQRYDFITNLRPRTYPYGVACEIIRVETLKFFQSQLTSLAHKEHVTSGLYDLVDDLEIGYLMGHQDWSHLHLTVDTPEDAKLLDHILEKREKGENLDYNSIQKLLQTQEKTIKKKIQ